MTREQAEMFRSAIAPFLPDWKSFEFRVIAERGATGDWGLNSMRAILSPERPEKAGRTDLPQVEGLLTFHRWRPVDELPKLIDSLLEGRVDVNEEAIDLKRPDSSSPVPHLYMQSWDRQHMRAEFDVDYRSFILKGEDSVRGRLRDDAFRRLDDAVRVADPPWDGLEDLRRNFMRIPDNMAARTDLSSWEVVAPIGVHIEDTELRAGVLNLTLGLRPGVDRDEVAVALFADYAGGRKRVRKQLGGGKIPDGSGLNYEVLLRVPKDFNRLSCRVMYRRRRVDDFDRWGSPVAGSLPRWASFHKIAGSLDTFREFLEAAHGHTLESAVALLFHQLGFSVGNYGFRSNWGTGKEVDLVAIPESEDWFLLIEVTEREPDLNNKMTKLSTRTKEVQRTAQGYLAYPVMVTTCLLDVVSKSNMTKAATDMISLVTADRLDHLFQLVVEGAAPGKVRDSLEQFIPKGQGFSQDRWPRK